MSIYELIQGNCLDVLPTLEDESVDLIIADPPYNIGKFFNDSKQEYHEFSKKWLIEAHRVLKYNKSIYVFSSQKYMYILQGIMEELFKWENNLIWFFTNSGAPWRKRFSYRISHEPILYYIKGTETTFNFYEASEPQERWIKYKDKRGKGKRSPLRDILIIPQIKGNFKERTKHPTQKPEDLIKKLISVSSNENDLVLDPFVGSGTTIKATQDLGRSCIGIETKSTYCDLIKKRCFGRTFLDREVNYEFSEFNNDNDSRDSIRTTTK